MSLTAFHTPFLFTGLAGGMRRRIRCTVVFVVLGLSCLLLSRVLYLSHTFRLPETNVGNSTFLLPDAKPESVTDRQLCRSVLQRAQSFRQGLLEECERLSGNLPAFKTFLESTLAYLSWHSRAATQTAPAKRSLTWKCLKRGPACGGYGDQIRGMAYAFLLALLTERVLYIQWPTLYAPTSGNDNTALGETMFAPNVINWRLPMFLTNVTAVQFVDTGPHNEARGVCEMLHGHTQHITYTTTHWHYSCFNGTLMGTNSALNEFINSPMNVLECATTIIVKLLLKYSKPVCERKKELKRELGIDPHSHFAAVHIRTGMFPSGLTESAGRLQTSVSAWERNIKCALYRSKVLGVTGPLVLITDSMQCKQWVREKYGKQVLSSSVSALHIAIDTKSRSDLTTEENVRRYHSVLDTTAEMALLSDAAVVVMAASGFSRVGTWLGGLSSDVKICCNKPCANYHLVYV